ncbi:hypothetical protein [Nostoc sp.]|uniref:hypothetical protein n=1 Tax=Nostoc sp. TaxID=1180 RepID=UPI002FF7F0D3
MKNSTHKGMGHGAWGMGHGAWGMGHGVKYSMPNTSLREAAPMAYLGFTTSTPLSTSRRGEQPRPPTLGMEFPAAFNQDYA